MLKNTGGLPFFLGLGRVQPPLQGLALGTLQEVAVGLQGLAAGLGMVDLLADGALTAQPWGRSLAIGKAWARGLAAARHIWRGRQLRPRFF